MLKKILTFLFALLPFKLANLFLILLGHNISWRSRIGLTFLWVSKITLKDSSIIGHLNFIKVESITLNKNAVIHHLNIFKGPFDVFLDTESRIQKNNKFTSAYFPVSYGRQFMKIGKGSTITSNNFFDLTNSITFGDNCQVAGLGSQFWTHGYVHADSGVDRIRIDGDINIGNNVYIGSRCLFNPGVRVASAINIGGNSVISKDLLEKGMYVNQTLRHIDTDINLARKKFKKVNYKDLIEEVYTKNS